MQLQEARKDEQFGVKIEEIWEDADRDYIPHRLGLSKKRVGYVDEDKGWRGPMVKLGGTNWQSDVSQPNLYVKINIAVTLLVDQNPKGVFTALSKKYQATTEVMKQLYDRSWEVARSRQQLKLFVYNLAKYGWAAARTYPLRITRKVRQITDYDQEEPDNTLYEEKEVVEYNDVYRENLNPWNVWIDDMARPNNQFAIRDWCWRKVYSLDSFKEEFDVWKNVKYVEPGGIVTEKLDDKGKITKKYKDANLIEVLFYENKLKDLFMVIANGVPVVIAPLPIGDSKGNKVLSLWQTYWTLRHAESPLGIGIYEAIRNDQSLLDRINNMSIDQLTLSIYKMFFYQGTNQLTETGEITISPGVGKQTLDPKNINFLEVPGPGRESIEWRMLLRQDLDENSGITDPLLGNITGKTAFEIAQAKESALKRLKGPLDNITDALNEDARITLSLIQLLYSIPEVYTIVDPLLIEDYLQEVKGDSELYERDEEGSFVARVFPEFPLNLDEDDKGNLIETDETRFFRIKPRFLRWEGIVNVKSQSTLTPSKQVDKALELEMWNVLIPLIAQPPELYAKAAKAIVKLYDKDPRDVLPDFWFQDQPTEQPLFIPATEQQASQQPINPGQVVQPRAQGIVSNLSGAIGSLNPLK